jgi:uncharacterized membrane protein
MSDIGFYHPLIVHFVIALAIVGVLLRWISFTGVLKFTGPAAAALLLAGTAAAVVAARSGSDASIAVEAVPGSAALVAVHGEWGLRTRNLLLIISVLEILALVGRTAWTRLVLLGSAVAGLVALGCIYETGERGGDLVYAHAAGVGIRSGDPADVEHLLLAALYHQAQADERAGRADDAAALIELAARRFPFEPAVQLLMAESLLEHRHDPATALTVLRRIAPAAAEPQLRFRRDWLTADALEALDQPAAARTVLAQLRAEFPDNQRLRRRLERAGRAPS